MKTLLKQGGCISWFYLFLAVKFAYPGTEMHLLSGVDGCCVLSRPIGTSSKAGNRGSKPAPWINNTLSLFFLFHLCSDLLATLEKCVKNPKELVTESNTLPRLYLALALSVFCSSC